MLFSQQDKLKTNKSITNSNSSSHQKENNINFYNKETSDNKNYENLMLENEELRLSLNQKQAEIKTIKEEAINAIVEKEQQIRKLEEQICESNIDQIYQENHSLKEQYILQRDQNISQIGEYERMIQNYQNMQNEISIKYNSIQQEYFDLEADFNEKVTYLNNKELEWLQENQINMKLFDEKTLMIENLEKQIKKIKEQDQEENELLKNQLSTYIKIIKTLEQKSEEYLKKLTLQEKIISDLNQKMNVKKKKLKVIQENLQTSEQYFKDNIAYQEAQQNEKDMKIKETEQFASELIDNFTLHMEKKDKEIDKLKKMISLLETKTISKKNNFKQKYEQLSLKKELECILGQNQKQKKVNNNNKKNAKGFNLIEDGLSNPQYDELIQKNQKLTEENEANELLIKRLKEYIITTDERWATENNTLRDDYNAIVKQNQQIKAELINLNDQLKLYESISNKVKELKKGKFPELAKSAAKPSTTKAKSYKKFKFFK